MTVYGVEGGTGNEKKNQEEAISRFFFLQNRNFRVYKQKFGRARKD